MIGKELRISQIIHKKESTLLDLSHLVFPKVKEMNKIVNSFDGIILNTKQIKKFSSFLNFKNSATSLLRIAHSIDNILKKSNLSTNLTPSDALKMGASACIFSFYFGYGDELESENVKIITHLMRSANKIALPIFVDVRCDGPKIDKKNFSQVVKLSITMLTEWGADGILIPTVEESILEELKPFSPPPLFIREKEEKYGIIFKGRI